MMKFEEMGLSQDILKAISELGFEVPTPIQQETIPELLVNGQDLVGLAQTGTGKTAAFGIPIIQQTDPETKIPMSLILCPTRELCMQITKDLKSYSKYIRGINITAVYGGASIDTQIMSLRRGSQIVVGTPGRVKDLINRGKLVVSQIKWLILDEADEMLSMGFKDDLDEILETTPKEKQVLLFSATMPKEIQRIASRYMTNPKEIAVGKRNQGAENVDHVYFMVQARDRYEALKRIADVNPDIYGIVFCRTRMETKEVADKFMRDGYNADALHGDLSQAQRDLVMNRFRMKHLQILVATDVAARGLDVTDLTHIINYNLPDDMDVYVHRSGRTGRAGKKGTAMTIVHSREQHKIRTIEHKVGKKFERKMVPNGQEVCEKRLFNLIDKFQAVEIDEKQIEAYIDNIYIKLEHMSREELIKRYVSVEFNRFLEYYQNARDLNNLTKTSRVQDEREHSKEKRRKSRQRTRFTRFYINAGSKDRITAQSLMGKINDNLPVKNAEIGKIEIMKKFSFFEIDSDYENVLMEKFKNVSVNGKDVFIELVKKERQENPSYSGDGGKRRSDKFSAKRSKNFPKKSKRRS
jgi:ATP-dependent RNA helicase DeaD